MFSYCKSYGFSVQAIGFILAVVLTVNMFPLYMEGLLYLLIDHGVSNTSVG